MTRHLADKPRNRQDDIRLREYLRIEREKNASSTVARKTRRLYGSEKLRQFLRIAKGELA